MADYQLTETDDAVIRTADGATIPNDPRNADWMQYEVWLTAGGVPDPYVPPPKPEPPKPDAVVVQMQYRAKSITRTIADPGNGFIVWDTVAQADAGRLAISARSDSNIDQGTLWRASVGSYVVIQDSTNAAQMEQFKITSVIDNGYWFDMEVMPISAMGEPFSGNNPLYVLISSREFPTSPLRDQPLEIKPFDMGPSIAERLGA